MSSKSNRSEHYRAIAEFYGTQLAQHMGDRSIPDFVLVESARRAARFAAMALKLEGQRNGRPERRGGAAGHQSSVAISAA